MTDLSTICKCIQNAKVLSFVKQNLLESYCSNYQKHAREMIVMLEKTFRLLQKSQANGVNSQKLAASVKGISHDIFKTGDSLSWFSAEYKEYKYKKAEKDLLRIREMILGRRILDFGSGYGYLSLDLKKEGYEVFSTDVLDYRISEAREIAFTQMNSSVALPSWQDSFDTIIVKSVLHHIAQEAILLLLEQFGRITKRVILCENVYNVPQPYISSREKEQQILKQFDALTRDEQFQCLILTDFFTNAVAMGNLEMNYPCTFKTIAEWEDLFVRYGFSHKQTLFIGFEPGKMTRNCQVWIIFDKELL